MKKTSVIRMQINAIKNPGEMCVMDFGDTVLLLDRHKGTYIKKGNLLIDLGKIRRAEKTKDDYNPKTMKLIKIKKTNHLLLMDIGKIAARFDTDDGEHIWVRNDWIKEYDNAFNYATDVTKTAVIPIGIRGEPLGFIMCVRVNGAKLEGKP